MTLVRRVVELGRAARAASSVKTRQPLSRALVSAPGWAQLPVELVAEVSDELNVRAVEVLGEEAGLVDVVVKPNFRELGKRFGKRTPVVAQAITDVEPATLANGVRGDGSFSIMVDSESEDVYADDIIVTESPREGWTVASDAEESVAIDLHIDDELRRAGLARDLIRGIQETRKSLGFDISDRISLTWSSHDSEIETTFAEHGAVIASEVLATAIDRNDMPADYAPVETDLPVLVGIARNS
jgi:isoleucyl-tRNA synthetase